MISPNELDLSALGVTPRVAIEAPDGDVTSHIWQHGKDKIIGVQRDFAPDASRETVVVTLPQQADVYDLRTKLPLGHTDHVTVALDRVSPALLSVTPR